MSFTPCSVKMVEKIYVTYNQVCETFSALLRAPETLLNPFTFPPSARSHVAPILEILYDLKNNSA